MGLRALQFLNARLAAQQARVQDAVPDPVSVVEAAGQLESARADLRPDEWHARHRHAELDVDGEGVAKVGLERVDGRALRVGEFLPGQARRASPLPSHVADVVGGVAEDLLVDAHLRALE